MNTHIIKNWDTVARTDERVDALSIVEAGLDAINTKKSIKEKISVKDDILFVDNHQFNLKDFDKIVVFAFGKASIDSTLALEEVLGYRINHGIGIDKRNYEGLGIKIFEGTHPYPSLANVSISTKIADTANALTEKDLAIVVVSGGGSALLCYPESECDQGNILYDEFLKSGGGVRDLNIIRKHLSDIKGGGLAKMLYPATVISLILCDVPGGYNEDVASGPTFKDNSTVDDAKKLLKKFNIKEDFTFNETSKEDKYFEKVYNVSVLSNVKALEAMKVKAEGLGYDTFILGAELYDKPEEIIKKMMDNLKSNTVVLAGGEPSIMITKKGGNGGRNEHSALWALELIHDDSLFISIASDGIDNKSKYAGVVVDKETIKEVREKNLNEQEAKENFNEEPFFLQTTDLIETGPTGSNVSDLFLLLKK